MASRRRCRAGGAVEKVGKLLLGWSNTLYSAHLIETGEAAERRAAEAGRSASSATVH